MKHQWSSIAVFVTMIIALRAGAEQLQKLRVVVTSASGNSVYLDKGRADGIVEGLDVRLYPDGAAIIGVVRAASTNSARVEFAPGVEIPPIGTLGEIEIPSPELDGPPADEPMQEKPPVRQTPEHPPWSSDMSGVDADAPLLAPVNRQDPRTRPYTFRGRAFSLFRYTHDMGEGRDNDYFTARFGTSISTLNLLGHGERIRLDTDVDWHRNSYSSRSSNSDSEWRIERFSYAVGGEDFSPYRFETGRFYSIYLPEIGLLDGAEGVMRFDNGLSAGVGFGLLPENDEERSWDGDMGAHVFMAYDSDEPGRVSAVMGYQKTWHDGEDDRDQIIARVNWRPTKELWLFGSVRADVYTNDDAIKGSGAELTEFWTQVRYTPVDFWGGAVSYTRFRWPEVLREDFVSIPIRIIEDGVVDRLSFSSWANLAEAWRLTGNYGLWSDQDHDGSNGDLGLEWSGPGPNRPTLGGAVFFTDGSFNSGEGFRVDSRMTLGEVRALLGYELFSYDLVTGFSGDDSIIRHLVRGGVSWNSGNWYFDLTGDYYFGEVDDAITIGAYVSYRF